MNIEFFMGKPGFGSEPASKNEKIKLGAAMLRTAEMQFLVVTLMGYCGTGESLTPANE